MDPKLQRVLWLFLALLVVYVLYMIMRRKPKPEDPYLSGNIMMDP